MSIFKHMILRRECILTSSQTNPSFTCMQYCLLKNTVGKGKSLVTSDLSFFHIVFYILVQPLAIFIIFENCRWQILSVWKSMKLVVWEKIKLCDTADLHLACLGSD